MANLITLEDVKAYSSISSTNRDAEITNLLPKVSELIKNYCGRSLIDFFSVSKIEVFNGGTKLLFLQEVPLDAVSLVEYSADYGKTYTPLVEFEDYAIDQETETISTTSLDAFPRRLNGYRVTYTGGYETTPEDLKLAAMDLVVYYMKSDMAVKSTRSAGSSSTQVEYIMNATLPSHIRRVLDSYRVIL